MKRILKLILFLFTSSGYSYSQSVFPLGLKTFSAQMHVHGLSNHNGHSQPASMQSHSFYADSTNTSVLWWSDHRAVYSQKLTSTFSFHNGVYNPGTLTISGLSGNNVIPVKWIGVKSGGTETVSMTDSSVMIGLHADSTAITFQDIYFSPRGTDDKLEGVQRFVRPVTSLPKINLDIKLAGLDSSTGVQLILLMSYHYYNGIWKQQSITYNFIDISNPFSRVLTDSSTLTVNLPVVNGIFTHFVIDIAADAQYLKDGIDNTTNDIRLRVKAKNNKSISANFKTISYSSTDSSASNQYQVMKGIENQYSARHGFLAYTGCEWTGDSHLNGFLPDSTIDRSNIYDDNTVSLGASYFADKIHQEGGVVSFDHPFGSSGSLQSISTQDYRTDTLAQFILNNNAYNSDLLEVGYTSRGGGDLDHHLRLWDVLTANQLFLYGDGVNDSHGGSWYTTNRYVTWIWAADSTPTGLIAGLKSGKCYFGDNTAYQGDFYFKVGTAEMGDRLTATYQSAPLTLSMTNIPANAQFRLTQGLILPGLNVSYVYHDSVFDPQNPPCLSLSEPCFIRISVYNNGVPFLFSNPVVFTSGALVTDSVLCAPGFKMSLLNDDNQLKVFPNPAHSILKLQCNFENKKNIKVSVLNPTGNLIKYFGEFHALKGMNEFDFNLMNLSSGNYYLLVEDGQKKKIKPFIVSY